MGGHPARRMCRAAERYPAVERGLLRSFTRPDPLLVVLVVHGQQRPDRCLQKAVRLAVRLRRASLVLDGELVAMQPVDRLVRRSQHPCLPPDRIE